MAVVVAYDSRELVQIEDRGLFSGENRSSGHFGKPGPLDGFVRFGFRGNDDGIEFFNGLLSEGRLNGKEARKACNTDWI